MMRDEFIRDLAAAYEEYDEARDDETKENIIKIVDRYFGGKNGY